jgi:1,4-alpha-glucan branching enzyme
MRNIAVLFDWVPNHLSDKNIVENWGCYIYPDSRSFTDFGPKPDYRSPHVRSWLLDNLQLFLLMFHFDGVRVDSTGTMRLDPNGQEMFEAWSLMQHATSIIREMKPKAIIIAEDLKHNPALHYVAGFDAQWEDNFFRNMLDVVSSQNDSGVDLAKLRDALNGPEFLADLDRMHRVIFTENHDTIPINRCNRIPVAIASKAEPSGDGWDGDGDNNAEHNVISLKRSTMAAAILFCAPGIPMILAGQELYEIYGSEWPIPPPIDWSRKQSYSGICQLYSDLIKLRKNSGHSTAGLTSPNFRIFHENHFEKVMAFHRYLRFGPSDDTIVVVNASSNIKNGYRLGIPRPGRWFNRCNTDDQRYYAEFDGCLEEGYFDVVDFPHNEPYDGFPFSIWFSSLPRYSVIILSQ